MGDIEQDKHIPVDEQLTGATISPQTKLTEIDHIITDTEKLLEALKSRADQLERPLTTDDVLEFCNGKIFILSCDITLFSKSNDINDDHNKLNFIARKWNPKSNPELVDYVNQTKDAIHNAFLRLQEDGLLFMERIPDEGRKIPATWEEVRSLIRGTTIEAQTTWIADIEGFFSSTKLRMLNLRNQGLLSIDPD